MATARLGRPSGSFTQHRRLDRLREILAKHPHGISLYDLADRLHVTVRTMRRYLKEIEKEYDLEKISQPGKATLWRIRASELPRKVELRRTQAYALLAARRLFEPLRGSALFDEIDLAVNKLLDFAQRPGRGPNAGLADAQLEDRFLYLPYAPKQYTRKTEELDDLFQAVSDLRPLRLLYRRGGSKEEDRITIHPYAMVLHRDSIYAVGLHVEKEEIRTFVLDRMRDTEAAATERFDLPKDFSVDKYFEGDVSVWRGRRKAKVIIDFDAQAAEYIRMRRVHKSQKLSHAPGGGIRLTMTVGSLTPLVSWILEWGPRATVVEPEELVDAVRTELEQALKNYGPRRKGRRKS